MNDTFTQTYLTKSLAVIAQEIQQPSQEGPSESSQLADLLSRYSKSLRRALFLGLAGDGLPVLLDLSDPFPGPLLVTGDAAAARTALLKLIARGIDLTHSTSAVEYAVLSAHINDWKSFPAGTNSNGLFSIREPAAHQFIHSLVKWGHQNKGQSLSVVVLIDDLASVLEEAGSFVLDLRWLFSRGPSRRIWPIVALDSSSAPQMSVWLEFFRSRIFGRIIDKELGLILAGDSASILEGLVPANEFALREADAWLRVRIPETE